MSNHQDGATNAIDQPTQPEPSTHDLVVEFTVPLPKGTLAQGGVIALAKPIIDKAFAELQGKVSASSMADSRIVKRLTTPRAPRKAKAA